MINYSSRSADTICAIATGMGDGAIGIIRLSGPDAFPIADRVFRGKKRIAEMPSYTAAFGKIVCREPFLSSGEEKTAKLAANPDEAGKEVSEQILDETVVLVMRAPHTYTTEDTVEFQCHGGTFGLSRVLELLVTQGARIAEPGEFTKRAFLGGRIDMSQAEAVMDVIRAENDAFYRASQDQLGGLLRAKIKGLRNIILTETARIESALDDPEHYDLTGYSDELADIMQDAYGEIMEMLRRSNEGIRMRSGIPTVIAGLPNVGKSSIMNALLGIDRAIVTSEEGTTRDTLTETIQLGNLMLRLTDTAGIRETLSRAEEAGIRRSYASMEEAELVLLVLDASRKIRPEEAELIRKAGTEKTIILLNKEDVDGARGKKEAAEELLSVLNSDKQEIMEDDSETKDRHALKQIEITELPEILEISAREGTGLSVLRQKLEERFLREGYRADHEPMITSARHKEALVLAAESLSRVQGSIRAGMPEDFLTIDLMAAYEALGRITGETLEDDLADKIFAEFCMGK